MRTQEVFRALSDPTRREILKLLQGGSLTAGEIAERFPQTKASLSHHFNILKAGDLVRSDRRGQNIVYSLNTSVLEDVSRLVLDLLGPGSASSSAKPEPASKAPTSVRGAGKVLLARRMVRRGVAAHRVAAW